MARLANLGTEAPEHGTRRENQTRHPFAAGINHYSRDLESLSVLAYMGRIKATRTCETCSKQFDAHLSNVYKGKGRFCSVSCSSSRQRSWTKQPNVKCSLCQKPFYKNKSKQAVSKSGHFFCCRAHRDAALKIGGISEIQPFKYRGKTQPSYDYREFAFAHFDDKCNRCNYNAFTSILIVHHKDRDRSNNDLSNLEILCPNCHALEHIEK